MRKSLVCWFTLFKFILVSVVIIVGLYSRLYLPPIDRSTHVESKRRSLTSLIFLSNSSTPDNEEDECPVQDLPKFHNITSNHDYCTYVKNNSDCRANEWIRLYYCGFYPTFANANVIWLGKILFFSLGIFFVVMMFYLIADTTDVYFSPAIIKIVDYLRIPATVAGVTLLAFGNGSPDLFSILAGLLTQNTSLALSAPIGAGVFVSGVVFGLVIIFAKVEDPKDRKICFLLQPAFKAATRSFVRDVIFYIIAISIVFFMYLLRFTSIFAGLGLVGIYFVYVVVVVGGNYVFKKFYYPWKIERDKVKRERARHKKNAEKRKKRKKKKSKKLAGEKTGLLDEDDYSSDDSVGELDPIEKEISKYIEPEIEDDWTGGWNIRAIAPTRSVKEKQLLYLKKYSKKQIIDHVDPSNRNNMETQSKKMEPKPIIDVYHSGLSGHEKRSSVYGKSLPSTFVDISGGVSPPLNIQGGDISKRDISKDLIDEHPGEIEDGLISALIQDDYFSPDFDIKKLDSVDNMIDDDDEEGKNIDIIEDNNNSEINGIDVDAVVQSVAVALGKDLRDESEFDAEVAKTLQTAHEVVITKKEPVIKALFTRVIAGIGWEEMSWPEKIFYFIFGWYTRLLRDITIPRSEPEHWNKLFASCTPFFGALFASYTFFKLMNFLTRDYLIFLIVWFSATAIVGSILSVFMFISTGINRPPIYNFLLVFFAFISSICWVYNAAEILVKILSTFGKVIDINPSVLGLTVLAWGNSFPDMVANINIARKGYPQMAMGACFGEPLLNSLIGVGVLFTWMSVNNWRDFGYACYPLGTDPSLMISFFTLIFQSVLSLVVLTCMRFRIRKFYGFVLIAIYLVQLVLALAASFDPNHVGWFFGIFRILTRAQTHKVCPIASIG